MAQNVTFKLTVDNKGIVTGSRQATKEVKAVDRATASAKKRTGALSRAWKRFGGVVTGLAIGAVLQRTFRRAIRVGKEFQTQLADLEAITGITGDSLKTLGDAALNTSSRYGVAAREIVEAQKLVASQLAQKIDFGTDEGIEQLREVADQAVLLQQAAGIDLNTAVTATTTALNQFNLEAEETGRVINTIAAGAKFGAAEARDQAEAYRDSGTAFSTAGQSLESLNAAVQILAANAIRGSRAGTGLRNIITRLETRADKLAENGFKNVNLEADGFAVTMGKLTPLLADVSARSEIFGEEAQGLAAILIENADALLEMESAVTGTDVAMEQAEIKLNTFETAVNRLSTSFDNNLIKSFQETSGAGVQFINMLTDGVQEIGSIISWINELVDGNSDLKKELQSTEDGIRGFIQANRSAIEEIESAIETQDLQGKSLEDAKNAIRTLKDEYKSILPEFEAYEKGLKEQIEEEEEHLQHLIDTKEGYTDNIREIDKTRKEIGRLTIRLSSARDVLEIYREEVDDTTESADDFRRSIGQASVDFLEQIRSLESGAGGVDTISKKIKDLKEEFKQLINQDEITSGDETRLVQIEREVQALERLLETRQRSIEMQAETKRQKDISVSDQISDTESLTEAIARRNIEEGKVAVTVTRTGDAAEDSYDRQSEGLSQVEEAALRAATAAALRADSAGEAANIAIDAILAEIVAIAIKKVMQAVPFPFNLIAAPAVAGVARGFRSLIPEFAEGGVVTGGAGQAGLTAPGQKLISINERKNPEFIVNDRSTEAALPLLDRINSSPSAAKAISRQVMGFAGGGRVTGADVPAGRRGVNTDEIADAVRRGMQGVILRPRVDVDRVSDRIQRHEDFQRSIGN